MNTEMMIAAAIKEIAKVSYAENAVPCFTLLMREDASRANIALCFANEEEALLQIRLDVENFLRHEKMLAVKIPY